MNTTIEKELFELIGDNHQMTSAETPLRFDAFQKSDAAKMLVIEDHFFQIMEELGLDMNDDSLKGTPHRVAKMFIQEIFSGLNQLTNPKYLFSKTRIIMIKCLWKLILLLTLLVSIIFYPLLEKHI